MNPDDKPAIKFMISAEAPLLMSKACELLIKEMSSRAWQHTERNRRRTLQRQDVHAAVGESEVYDFLIDIVPRVTTGARAAGQAVSAAVPQGVPDAASMSPNMSLPPFFNPAASLTAQGGGGAATEMGIPDPTHGVHFSPAMFFPPMPAPTAIESADGQPQPGPVNAVPSLGVGVTIPQQNANQPGQPQQQEPQQHPQQHPQQQQLHQQHQQAPPSEAPQWTDPAV